MGLDKNQLKNLISKAKTSDILVLTVNNLEKDSWKLGQKQIVNFIKKEQDYTVIVMKR